jgi:hypothetical protein
MVALPYFVLANSASVLKSKSRLEHRTRRFISCLYCVVMRAAGSGSRTTIAVYPIVSLVSVDNAAFRSRILMNVQPDEIHAFHGFLTGGGGR